MSKVSQELEVMSVARQVLNLLELPLFVEGLDVTDHELQAAKVVLAKVEDRAIDRCAKFMGDFSRDVTEILSCPVDPYAVDAVKTQWERQNGRLWGTPAPSPT